MQGASQLRAFGVSQRTLFLCSTTPPVPVTATYADRDASGNVSVGDVIDILSPNCSGFPRKLALTLTQLNATLDQMAGRVEIDIQVDPPGMQVVGTFNISLGVTVATSEVTWRITDAVVTVTQANTTQTVRIASSQFTSTPTSHALSVTGGSVESAHLGGTYTFATTTPLAGAARRLPSSGELMLNTSGGSRAKVAPPATPSGVEETVEYSVAATSSGAFGPTQPTVWTAILRGVLFGWRPNVAPTLTSLQIQPTTPNAGAPLWVSYNAQDANGDALETTIEWQRNGAVVGNTQSLNITTARNDRISVTVTVSDGRGLTATATTSVTVGNPGPTLTLTLAPPTPNGAVDLVAMPNVFEPDGDPVTLTYEWSSNGTVIANQTAAVLPASETIRGQTISVRVTASDGTSTVEATASVIIVDAPPVLSVASPPTTVAHGAPVTFTATLSDPDGDPVDQLDFVLAYGPAGMTVDPDTGAVNWTASGPMFDRTMDVAWGITVDDPTAQLATGTLEVTDSSRDYPQLRFGMQIPTWPAGLSVGDFDDDGDDEMLIMSERWLFELESDGAGGYRQAWAYPYVFEVDEPYSYGSMKSSLATGDVDDDGRHEIFAAVGSTITKLDGVERRPTATTRLANHYDACNDLVYTDLENDGANELVCLESADFWASDARILVLRADDLSLRYTFPSASYGASLAVGNVDADAALEIVTANGYVFDGATFVNQWLYGQGFGMDVDTGDFDGNGVEEIVATAGGFLRGYRTPPVGSGLPISPIWEAQHFELASLHVADIGGDARPEILVGDGQWGEFMIYRYNTATNSLDIVDQISSQDHGVTAIGVGDVDADGELEFIWGTGLSHSGADELVVAGRNPTLTVEWTNTDPVQLDGPFRGGTLAGGPLDSPAPLFLSLRTNSGYGGSRLVRTPADGGAIQISAEIATNWYGNGGLDVVDYDNDGVDEAFVATGAYYDGLFTVYDFFGAATDWSSPLSQAGAVDVTHADLTGDGNDDLVGLTASIVYVHDVDQQSLFWQSTTLNGAQRVHVADVDGNPDGRQEIVVVAQQYVYVYRDNPPPIRYVQTAIYQTDRSIIDADVGDTDGDGQVEVVLLVGPMYAGDGNEIVRLDGSLLAEGTFSLPWPAQTVDIEPSPTLRKNLLVSRPVGQGYDSTLAIVGARSGGVVFESPPLIGAVQRGSVHYVTLPGETRPRMSIGTSAGMYLTR